MNQKKIAVVIPTAGHRTPMLRDLISQCHEVDIPCFIVRTSNDAVVPSGVEVLEDYGPTNIQRWWNLGIQSAISQGFPVQAVLNDDIFVSGPDLLAMAEALSEAGATLASPGIRKRLYRTVFPFRRVLDGACWLLNSNHGLRPDERYHWGYGDDELDIQARIQFSGVLTMPIRYTHPFHNQATEHSSYLRELSTKDRLLFDSEHPLVAASRRPRQIASKLRRKWSHHPSSDHV